jgi:WD40 repeat protein
MDVRELDAVATAAPEAPGKRYDAFISYAHDADGVFAPVVQRGLQRLAKPWNRRRAMEVFRDETSLPVSSGLWPSIRAAIDASRWLVVLASPEAARSDWVGEEIKYWVATKGTDHLLVVVTSGTWAWDSGSGDLSPGSTAGNRALCGVFPAEPKYLDMTWARRDAGLTLRNARFRDQMATLVAAIREVPKEEIEGEDVRQQRRTRRVVRAAIAALSVLAVLASAASVLAYQRGQAAIQQRNQAIHTQTMAEAAAFATTDTPVAAQLNLAAYGMQPTPDLTSRLLSTQNSPLATPLTGDRKPAYSVAYSPDGHTLASSSYDGTIRFWDVADSGHPRALGKVETSSTVLSVAFSPDGRTLASGSSDGRLRTWNVTHPADPRLLSRTLVGLLPINSVAFSPDGQMVATGGDDGEVWLWYAGDPAHPFLIGGPLKSLGTAGGPLNGRPAINSVKFSPDGRTLAIAGEDQAIQLWDVADPIHPRRLGPPLTGQAGPITSLAFSPDGETLASGSYDNTIWLRNVADPEHPHLIIPPLTGGTGPVYSVAFSRDGDELASGDGDGTVRLWNTADPAHPQPLFQPVSANAGPVASLAFSPDDHTLASGSNDGPIWLWNLPPTVLTGHTSAAFSVAFSHNGHILASGEPNGTLLMWDVANPARPRAVGGPLPGGVISLAFSPDDRMLATGGGFVRLWDLTDPARPRLLGDPLDSGVGGVPAVAFSLGGHLLASGGADGRVRLWNVTDPAHPASLGKPLGDDTRPVFSVAFSPDDHLLASGSLDGRVRLWDVSDPAHPVQLGQPLSGGTGSVFSVAFSRDGRALADADADGTVRLWDVTHPAHPVRLGNALTGNTGGAYSVTFSPHGHMLASGNGDGTIQLWDVVDLRHPRALGQPLTGHTGTVYSVAFSPDGRTLASGSGDLTVRLWNLNVSQAKLRICAATRNVLTPRVWAADVAQLPYQPPCGR